MKKLLILSGKGGTGKTTTAAAFVRFAQAKVMADCDVDAPNLHLIAAGGEKPALTPFIGSEKAHIDPCKCSNCGQCVSHCRFDAIHREGSVCRVEEIACEGCGVCAYVCPAGAIALREDIAGQKQLYTDGRVFSTAELAMGRGNSGKLVTEVKQAMLKSAPADADIAVIDGSPGIGCPVIASVSGVDLVLVVAEPSVSGLSDLTRLVHTARSFQTKLAVCVNKWNNSPEQTAAIEAFCAKAELPFVGRIPYDSTASAAINSGLSVADIDCPARDALRAIYAQVRRLL